MKQVSGIPAAYCQRPMLTLAIAEAQYKAILRDMPHDRPTSRQFFDKKIKP
jgi:hypothetical protein